SNFFIVILIIRLSVGFSQAILCLLNYNIATFINGFYYQHVIFFKLSKAFLSFLVRFSFCPSCLHVFTVVRSTYVKLIL
ncbi:hypothetical protein NDU88_002303, partial [Pleurodeles waltl]